MTQLSQRITLKTSMLQPANVRFAILTGLAALSILSTACDRTRPITASGDPPIISSLSASPATIQVGEAAQLTVVASDPLGGTLTYEWDAGLGDVFGTGAQVYYNAQWCCLGANDISVRVINESGGVAVATVRVTAYAPL